MGFRDGTAFNMTKLLPSIHLSNEKQAVNDIHDILKTYYKVAIKRFTDNVVLQVTERCILSSKGPVRILSPDMIGNLGERELIEIAGENYATLSIRHELITKQERYQKALEVAKEVILY